MPDETIPGTAEVFNQLSALTSVAPEPGGVLVFYGDLDRRGMAAAVAANIAGAASLAVDAHADRVKLALRHGICDFMVNSLDEALRILKNEIRKKQPVAVGLVGGPDTVVAEMMDRGVQPDFVLADVLQAERFIERGAQVIPSVVVAPDSFAVTWSVAQDAPLWLPRVDALAAEAIGNLSDARVKWLRLAPRYLQKGLLRERYVRMREDELARFIGLLQERLQSGEIAVPVSVSRDGTLIETGSGL